MTSVGAFVDAVLQNAASITCYMWGYDGRRQIKVTQSMIDKGQFKQKDLGKTQTPCDCIGLNVGAMKILGKGWAGVHGTNYTVRHKLKDKVHLNSADDLKIGMLVFKCRAPGEKGYDLPSDYRSSADQNDYYHVGTVIALNPVEIIHCTSVPGGIKVDDKLGTWKLGGMLKDIGENVPQQDISEDKGMYIATLHAPQGDTVNVRNEKGAFVKRLPVGSEVEVISVKDGKAYVKYGEDKYGYIKTEFLKDISEMPGVGGEQADKVAKIESLLQEAIRLLHEMTAAG